MGNQTFLAIVSIIIAVITTAIIVVPLLCLMDHLEISGTFKAPEWIVTPAVIGIASLCYILSGIYGKLLIKEDKQKEQQEPRKNKEVSQ